MRLFYVSNLCSQARFEELFVSSDTKPEQATQKFHSLLCKGIQHINDEITAVTVLPLNGSITKKKWFPAKIDSEEGIVYCHLPAINYPVIKHLFDFLCVFFALCKYSVREKQRTYFCDALNLTSSIAVLIVSAMFRGSTVAIITDVPQFADYSSTQKSNYEKVFFGIHRVVTKYTFRLFSHYIFLTEQMNELINVKGKPYTIVEGVVDLDEEDRKNDLDDKYDEKVIVYAGALREKYGVRKLLRAFMMVENPEVRLWIYGAGELEDEVAKFEGLDERIEYKGVLPNHLIMEVERRATLLVNPRPSDEVFTEYSFPSKNIEYMVSGTPLLTTKLPGIPEEYFDYVFLIEDESETGFAERIEHIISLGPLELHRKGLKAKKFVLENKSHIAQAEKVIKMLGGCEGL